MIHCSQNIFQANCILFQTNTILPSVSLKQYITEYGNNNIAQFLNAYGIPDANCLPPYTLAQVGKVHVTFILQI